MKLLRKAVPSAAPTKTVGLVSLSTAALIVVMTTAQLFAYEDFPAVLDGLWETSGMASAQILAAAIVVTEVFALPFLLFMRISPLMRTVSMACGWFVAFVWLLLSLWQTARPDVDNVGIFGATLPVENGIVALIVSLVLAAGVGYIAYTAYPVKRKVGKERHDVG